MSLWHADWKELGIKLLTSWLVDDPLHSLSHSRTGKPNVKVSPVMGSMIVFASVWVLSFGTVLKSSFVKLNWQLVSAEVANFYIKESFGVICQRLSLQRGFSNWCLRTPHHTIISWQRRNTKIETIWKCNFWINFLITKFTCAAFWSRPFCIHIYDKSPKCPRV